LEDNVQGEDESHAAKSEVKVDSEDGPQTESVNEKPAEAEQTTKTEPAEEIEVEVEEFYVKYKNL